MLTQLHIDNRTNVRYNTNIATKNCVVYCGGVLMMKKKDDEYEQQKEQYKQEIKQIIDDIDNLAMLEYFKVFISAKVKEGN